ncbi:MAG: hypothetical protein U0470_13610 [Anaerolineae bacterium]
MTDGRSERRAADRRRGPVPRQGSIPYTIGLGADLDFDLLASIASSPARFYAPPTSSWTSRPYADIGRRISGLQLFPHGDIVTSASRHALRAELRRSAGRLGRRRPHADLAAHGRADLRHAPDVRRQAVAGHRPTNERADVQYVDVTGADGAATFPVPAVEVSRSRAGSC